MELGERNSSLRPVDDVGTVRGNERDHVRCVGGDEVLTRLQRERERGLEERTSRDRISAGATEPTSLEVDPRRDGRVRAGKARRLVEKRFSCAEVTAQAAHASELRENFRTAGFRFLGLELGSQTLLRRIEVVEVPERSEAVVHPANPRARLVRW